jgi:predicted Zn-dependent peptidase
MPGFRAEDFKRVNKQYRESINNSKKSANNMASQAMAGLLYGKTIRGISPSVKGVEKLKLQDVKDFYRKQ